MIHTNVEIRCNAMQWQDLFFVTARPTRTVARLLEEYRDKLTRDVFDFCHRSQLFQYPQDPLEISRKLCIQYGQHRRNTMQGSEAFREMEEAWIG